MNDKTISPSSNESFIQRPLTHSHFSNIQLLNFDPKSNRASTNIDEDLIKMLPEKYSKDRYYGTFCKVQWKKWTCFSRADLEFAFSKFVKTQEPIQSTQHWLCKHIDWKELRKSTKTLFELNYCLCCACNISKIINKIWSKIQLLNGQQYHQIYSATKNLNWPGISCLFGFQI